MAERSLSLDRLYELSPDEFTSARNELAKSLRADGRRAEADEVAALRKPTLGAWVSNQLARTRGDSVRALVEAGELLRKVQATGKGDLRAATQDERAAISELLAEARTILQQAGRTPSEAALQPVRTTLAAAAADPDAASQLLEGRLARELEPPAFGGLLGAAPQRQPQERGARDERRAKAAETKARERELAQARGRVSAARRRAEAAQRKAERLRSEWERAEKDAGAAVAELEEAEAQLASLGPG